MRTGYDRYLEYQFNWSEGFHEALFDAISLADELNLQRLAKGFPEEVEAHKTFARIGRDEFLDKCSDDHPLKRSVLAGTRYL